MQRVARISAPLLYLVVFCVFIGVSNLSMGAAPAKKRIGVLMFSSELRYKQSLTGFLAGLSKSGYPASAIEVTVEDAESSKAKAAEVVKRFSNSKLDLIYTLGTTAAQAVTAEIKGTPVVFSSVYDPVAAGIAKSWKTSGNNSTGNSPRIAMATLISKLRPVAPFIRIGVLYTPGEKNSETQVADLHGLEVDGHTKIVPIPISEKKDIAILLPRALKMVDSVYITGSNQVGSALDEILGFANAAHIATFTHLRDLVERGVMLGVCSDPLIGGAAAGAIASRIFKGTKPEAIPIEEAKLTDVIYNAKTAKAAGITLPKSFLDLKPTRIE
jgi:putative ABC transport system substrate-binding protein